MRELGIAGSSQKTRRSPKGPFSLAPEWKTAPIGQARKSVNRQRYDFVTSLRIVSIAAVTSSMLAMPSVLFSICFA